MRFTVENVTDAVGLTGGILLALTLVPQIWVAIIGSNPGNINLSWQGTSLLGNVLILLFYFNAELWAVVLPLCMEMVFISLLIGVKIYLENTAHGKRRATVAALGKLRRRFIVKSVKPSAHDDDEGEPSLLERPAEGENQTTTSIDNAESQGLEEEPVVEIEEEKH